MVKNTCPAFSDGHGDNTCSQTDKTQPADTFYCDTLLRHFTKPNIVLTTTGKGCPAHLIKLQTLRGLINVPATFHKWGIDYNWFHSLIHLLKWHSFTHVLTRLCHLPLAITKSMRLQTHILLKEPLSFFFSLHWINCYNPPIHTGRHVSSPIC